MRRTAVAEAWSETQSCPQGWSPSVYRHRLNWAANAINSAMALAWSGAATTTCSHGMARAILIERCTLEVRDREGWLIEVPVVTAMRDAMGWIDHSIVHQGEVAFENRAHAEWLYEVSLAANVWDAEGEGW